MCEDFNKHLSRWLCSKSFLVFTRTFCWGNDSQFDKMFFFKTGWFNHQLTVLVVVVVVVVVVVAVVPLFWDSVRSTWSSSPKFGKMSRHFLTLHGGKPGIRGTIWFGGELDEVSFVRWCETGKILSLSHTLFFGEDHNSTVGFLKLGNRESPKTPTFVPMTKRKHGLFVFCCCFWNRK